MFAQLVPFGCPRLMARPHFPGGAPVRFRLSSVERKKSGAGPLPRLHSQGHVESPERACRSLLRPVALISGPCGTFWVGDHPDAAELKLASVQFSSFGPLAFETCSHHKRKIPRELKSPSGFMDQLTEMNRKIRDRRSRPKAGARSCFPRHVSDQVLMWRSE